MMKLAVFLKRSTRRIFSSKRALALPVTFLILFVTTLGLIMATYYFSVQKIGTQSETLKVSTARQNFLSLDSTIISTLWHPGTSATYDLADSGGLLTIQPNNNTLTITASDGATIDETVYDSIIGQVNYRISNLGTMSIGLYLRGSSQTITNQTGASSSQVFLIQGTQGPEVQLQYRPTVTYAAAGTQDDKTVTNIRIYLVNLNSSSAITSQGQVPLKISCVDTSLSTRSYNLTSGTENFTLTAHLGTATNSVSIPISSTPDGAIVNLETVVSSVTIERWIR
ncbi:MAG: hypothetical protein NWF01_03285 [Candidatus Bathyarchaeota archaeon]|nr:hypothetical protein [Candidatus Bathyarchaeota archaeon]